MMAARISTPTIACCQNLSTRVAVSALDRVLRWERFRVPQWYNPNHWVAYYDMYRYPENLPPYSLGFLDFWWIDPDAEAALRDAGAF